MTAQEIIQNNINNCKNSIKYCWKYRDVFVGLIKENLSIIREFQSCLNYLNSKDKPLFDSNNVAPFDKEKACTNEQECISKDKTIYCDQDTFEQIHNCFIKQEND